MENMCISLIIIQYEELISKEVERFGKFEEEDLFEEI